MAQLINQIANLEQNIRRLEEENNAKNNQIQSLRQKANRSNGIRVISPGAGTCYYCKNKDSQISNLNKIIQQLKTNHQNQIRNLNSSPKIQTKIVYRETQSTSQQLQVEALKRENQQLKRNLEELKKVESHMVNTDHSNQNFWQINQNLKRQNQFLFDKVQFLEKRIQTVQDSNAVMREEILNNQVLNNVNHKRGETATFIPSEKVLDNVQNNRLPITTTYIVQGPPTPRSVQTPATFSAPTPTYLPPPQLPTFTYISPPAHIPVLASRQVSFNNPSRINEIRQVKNSTTYLSPLAVLNNNRSSSSYELDYQKDILNQRWRSLQHKIKLLEQENGRLRTQVNMPIY